MPMPRRPLLLRPSTSSACTEDVIHDTCTPLQVQMRYNCDT